MADEDDDFDLDDFMGDDFDDFDEEDEDDLELELSPEDEEILEHLDEEPLPEAEAAVEAQAPAEAPSEATPAAEEAPAEATMPAADTAPVKAETAKAEKPVDQVGELPIKMMFELSTLHMPYEKVKEITEGSQIDIGVDLNAPITVRANGKVIGKGQLIQIEKNIGVQMTELWKNAK